MPQYEPHACQWPLSLRRMSSSSSSLSNSRQHVLLPQLAAHQSSSKRLSNPFCMLKFGVLSGSPCHMLGGQIRAPVSNSTRSSSGTCHRFAFRHPEAQACNHEESCSRLKTFNSSPKGADLTESPPAPAFGPYPETLGKIRLQVKLPEAEGRFCQARPWGRASKDSRDFGKLLLVAVCFGLPGQGRIQWTNPEILASDHLNDAGRALAGREDETIAETRRITPEHVTWRASWRF